MPRNGAPGGSFHTLHGRTLFVVDSCADDGAVDDKPTLVLLHGYPTSSHDYYRVLPDLAAHYRVIVHDHPGFGLSDKPAARSLDQATA